MQQTPRMIVRGVCMLIEGRLLTRPMEAQHSSREEPLSSYLEEP